RRRAAFREEVLGILDAGSLDPFLALVGDLADTHDPAELAAAAFKMAAQARESRRPGYTDLWNEPEPEAIEEAAPENIAFQAERPERPPRERGRREVAGRGFEGRGPRRGAPEGALARLFLRVGRRDGARPADLVGAIANEAGIPGDAIGDIDIYDTFSFVEVPEAEVEAVRAALNRTTIRGRAPRATLARPDEDWRERAEENRESRPPRRDARREPFPYGRETERHPFAGRSGHRFERFEREEELPRRPLRGPATSRRLPLPRKPAGYSSRSSAARPGPRGRRG
ncbi:MAG TPA: DbpA RNA binding domain-containing protein, partial [Ktedonobacterales bacterium]